MEYDTERGIVYELMKSFIKTATVDEKAIRCSLFEAMLVSIFNMVDEENVRERLVRDTGSTRNYLNNVGLCKHRIFEIRISLTNSKFIALDNDNGRVLFALGLQHRKKYFLDNLLLYGGNIKFQVQLRGGGESFGVSFERCIHIDSNEFKEIACSWMQSNWRPYLPPLGYRCKNIKLFPKEFEIIAVTWIFVCKKKEGKEKLNKDLIYLILEYMAYMWKFNGSSCKNPTDDSIESCKKRKKIK